KAGKALRIVINAMTQDFGRLCIGPKQSLFDVFANPPKAGEAISIDTISYEITSSPPSGAPRDDGGGLYCR
ncbi:MAG: hypothetical protein WCV56_07910, partial [Candidatus Omnitrophota bacterium]